jgi:hypothetical protein
VSKGEGSPSTPHAALHELLGRIIRVRAGMEPNFQSITERADKMSALAGEAILELVELERASETRGSDETGWLIENAERLYLTTDATGFFAWTKDNLDAIRFCRRQDAEKVASGNDDAWHVVEHMWSDPAPIEKMNVNTEKRGKP